MSDQTQATVQSESQSNRLGTRTIAIVIVALILLLIAFYFVFQPNSDQISDSLDSKTNQEVPDTSQETPSSDGTSASDDAVSKSESDTGNAESKIAAETGDPGSGLSEQASSAGMAGIELDIVRVEPTGEMLVAGKFLPNSIIIMESDNKAYGETKANESGEWVLELEEKLKPGSYLFQFFHKLNENAEKVADKTKITAYIPENEEEEPLLLLDREGEATEIVQLPKAREENDTDSVAAESESTDSTANTEETVAKTTPAFEETDAKKTSAIEETVAKTSSNYDDFNLSIRAVESEGEKLFIAGEGKTGIVVTVFVGDEKAGTAKPNSQNRWLLESRMALEPGTYDVVAQILDPESEEVLASVKVQFEKLPDSTILRPLVTLQQATGSGTSGSSSVISVGALPNVIIRRGDNLWTISRRLYGRGIRYTTIYQANKSQIDDPDLIFPGQIFLTPERDLNWTEE